MKKFNTFKTLAQGVKSFVAMLVITIMAVGNVFAQYTGVGTFEKISTLSELTTGYYVIANQGDQFAMLNTAGSYINKTDLVLSNPDNSIVWKIEVAGNGEVSIYNEAAGKYVAYYGTGNSGFLISTLNDSARWNVSLDGNSNWVFKNKKESSRQLSYNASNPRFACYKNNNQEELSLFKMAGATASLASPVFTPNAGTYYVPQNITITTETEGANIYYTLDGTTPDVNSTLYTAPFSVNATTTVKAIVILGADESAVKTAQYTFPTVVELANIAAFKEQTSTTDIYKINSDLQVVYQTADKYHTFVQDNTGGLYIYGTLANAYNNGDMITGGLYGTYSLYNQLSEMKPVSGTPLAAGVAGTAVEPIVVTLADLQDNYAAYEGRLVKVENVTIAANKVFTTNSAAGVAISQGEIETGFQIYNTFKKLNMVVNQGATANVTGLVIRYNQTIEIVPRENNDIQITSAATLPMNVTFETNSADSYGWVLDNGTATNKWFVGKAQGFNNNKLYISSSNGATNKYDIASSTDVKAYRDVVIPAVGATLSFDYRVNGQVSGTSYYDYLQVDIIKDGTATLIGKFAGNNDWNNFTYSIPASFAGNARLQFTWINNASAGDQFPAAVDNIILTPITCTPPMAMNITVDGASALVNWQSAPGQTAWTFEYKLANHSEWYTINTTDTFVNLTDLQGNSDYNVRVRTNCGDENSVWVEGSFSVDCQSIVINQDVLKTVGTGTSSNNSVGMDPNYYHCWDQTLYASSAIGSQSGTIKSISWHVGATEANRTIDNVKIYLGTTTNTSWSSTSNWVPMEDLTLVWEGDSVSFGAVSGWETYALQVPYHYDNTKNLVVVVSKSTQTTKSSAIRYSYTSTTNTHLFRGTTAMASTEYANHPGTATGTRNAYRSNIQLVMDEEICGDTEDCTQPVNLTISNVTYSSAEVNWQSADTDQSNYILQYKEANAAAWTDVNVTGTAYTLAGLSQNTAYAVRVLRNCGTNNYSEPTAVVNFATTTMCPSVTNIENSNVSNTTTLSWTPGGDESGWIVQLKPVAASESEWITLNVSVVPSTNFGGLLGNTPYIARIKTLCDATDGNNQSDWVVYNFTSGCSAFDIPVVENFENNSAIPSCWDHRNFSFTSNARAESSTAGAYLMSPAINIPTTDVTYLSFDVTTTGSYSVMASTRGTDLNRFTALQTSTEDGQVIIELPATYKGKIVYFAFINENGTITIDNFKVGECPFTPSNLVSTNITDNAVTLSWNKAGDVMDYQVQYGPKPNANSHMAIDAETATTIDVNDTVVTITGLTNGQAYDFYVRANCGSELGDWIGPLTRTAENALVMGTDHVATTCNAILHNDNYTVEGNANYSNNFEDTIVIYPATANSVIELRGTYATENNFDYIKIYDGVGTDGTLLASLAGTLNEEALLATSITGPVTVKFTSDGSSTYWGFSLYATCVPAPSCNDPENIALDAETNTLNWTDGLWGTPQSYNVKYFVVGETDTITTTASTNSLVISTLRAEVPYVFMVQSVCGDDAISGWAVSEPFVKEACAIPTEFAYTIDGNNIILTWDAYASQHDFVIEYKKADASTWAIVNVSDVNTYTIENLSELTAYNVRMKAVCASGDASKYTEEVYVLIPCFAGVETTIGTGTANSYYSPYNNFYRYSWNESIYTAAEVGSAGTISSVSFEVGAASTATMNSLKIYMGTRSTSTFANSSDWTSLGDLQLVYDGTNVVVGQHAGWEPITLTSPYYYNGTDNLVVVVSKRMNSYNSALKCNYTSTTARNMYRQQDSDLSYAEYPGTQTGTSSNYLPNVKFSICPNAVPTCFPVSNVVATTTATSATITWNAGGTETEWEVTYSLDGQEVTTTVTTPSITINGLTASTNYSIPMKIVSKCSATDEAKVQRTIDFITPCVAQTLPYFENFDSYVSTTSQSTMVMPSCWNRMFTGTSAAYGFGIYNSSTYATSGTNSLRLYNYYNTSTSASYGDAYAVLPEINANINSLMISFDARKYDNTSTNYFSMFEIGVMTDPNDVSTFTAIETVEVSTIASSHFMYMLNNYEGANGYIAFRALKSMKPSTFTGSYGYNYVFIDNLSIETIPTCIPPGDITVSTTTTTADVAWTAGGSETEWQISYELDGTPVTATVNTPSYTITGLTPSSHYTIELGVKAICSETDESSVTTAYLDFTTQCAPISLPYFENFDSYVSTTSQSTMVMPTCWNRLYTGTSTTYGVGIYNSSAYATSGTNALRLYNYYTTSTSAQYGDAYAVLPEINANINSLMVSFDVKSYSSTSSTYFANFDLGVVTDPADPENTFTLVQNYLMSGSQSAHIELNLVDFDGPTGRLAFRVLKDANGSANTSTYGYNYVFIDNLSISLIPSCFIPKNLTINNVQSSSVEVSWMDDYAQAGYIVEYKESDAAAWSSINTTNTTVTIAGLTAGTSYDVRVKAVCGADDESDYTDIKTVTTPCERGQFVMVGDDESTTTTYYYPINDFYRYGYSQQIFTAEEIGANGNISTVSFNYKGSTPITSKTNVKIYMANTDKNDFESTTDWITEDLQLVYQGAISMTQGWNKIDFTTPFMYNGGNAALIFEDMTGNYGGSSSSTFQVTNYAGQYRTLAYYNDSNPFEAGKSASTRVATRINAEFTVCPSPVDVAVVNVKSYPDACDITNPVVITVKNTGYAVNVSTFEAYYKVNEGNPVHETVTLATPIDFNETATYSFNQLPTFEEGANVVTAWIEYAGDAYSSNDTAISAAMVKLAPASVPYTENFNNATVNHGWNVIDANQDDVTFTITNGAVAYTYNDEAAANDWLISPCIHMTPGNYNVSYDYMANSALTENFKVFYGAAANVANMTNFVAAHTMNGTTAQTATTMITITTEGDYNFGIQATSAAGNLGFTVDNFAVLPIVDINVTAAANGTVTPMGVNAVNYGENFSISIIPDAMYHVAGVYVDGTQVVNEDPYSSSFMLYTLDNVTEPHTIFVDFKLEFHVIKNAVNARPDLYVENGGVFVPAATDTLIDPSAFTVNMLADEHYHLSKLELGVSSNDNPMDVTADVVYNGDRSYAYTIDTLVVSNYYLTATYRKDTVNVHYNILAGKGSVDASDVLTAPAQYDTWIDYADNHTCNIVPANGYYLVDVNGNGPAANYQINNVTAQADVNVKFGYQVNASIVNFFPENLGSNELRGTIDPTTALVVEGEALTLNGTVQEHFHLHSFLIDGVENIQNVVINNDGTFSYTFEQVLDNHNVQAIVRIDTVCIQYNVSGGLVTVDGQTTTADPQAVYTCNNYGSDWLTAYAPAPGYEIMNIYVDGAEYGNHDNYQFEFLTANHVIDIVAAPKTISVTTNGYGDGVVTPGITFTYDPAVSYTFSAVPNTGSRIASIMRNDVSVPVADPEVGYTETLNNIVENQNYVVYFASSTYTVTASANNGGVITPVGATTYAYNTTPTYVITPNDGYHISDVLVNGVSVGAVASYTFAALDADQTIEVIFANNVYTVTVGDLQHGTINAPAASYSYGATPTFTIVPDLGYVIADVTVDGQSVGAVASYTFAPIAANHTISATFVPATFTIQAVAGNGGSIAPAGTTTVNYGANQVYTISTVAGYHISDVFVDDISVGAVASYTFSNVTANHTIAATFAADNYTITVNQPAHGAITPGTQTVAYGATPTFTITPNEGYTVGAITYNGTNVIANATLVGNAYVYTVPAVTANATLTATMNAKTYTINATAGNGGTITPNGNTTVNYGATQAYTITPNNGYVIDRVTVDGLNMGAPAAYTFVNVTENHTISVSFKLAPCEVPSNLYTINITTNAATLTWYHAGAPSYEVRYKEIGATNFTTATATTNVYDLTNLQPNTSYVWQVRANCTANNSSDWSSAISFRTNAEAPVDPTGVEDYKNLVNVYASHNNVYIANDNHVRIDNVQIYDVYGKLIYSGKVNSNPEIISMNVATGSYMVRLTTENGTCNYKVFLTK